MQHEIVREQMRARERAALPLFHPQPDYSIGKANFTSRTLVLFAASYFHFLTALVSDASKSGLPPNSLISLTLPSGATVTWTRAIPRRFSFLASSEYSGGSPLCRRRGSSAPVSAGSVTTESAKMIARASRSTPCQFRGRPPARASGAPELAVRFLE